MSALIIVQTKYVPATDRRPARIRASAWTFSPTTRAWDHGLDATPNHRNAAIELLSDAGWSVDSIVEGWGPKGEHLWIATCTDRGAK